MRLEMSTWPISGSYTLRKITPAGVVTTLAGMARQPGSADGAGAEARFKDPQALALDASGDLYVADATTIRKVTAAGDVTTLAGAAGQAGATDGTGTSARFDSLGGMAVDASGNIDVFDAHGLARPIFDFTTLSLQRSTLRTVTPAGAVTTLAGASDEGSTDGLGAAAKLHCPNGVAVDALGNVYVADSGNHTIRKITPAGMVTTLAGTAGTSGSADGTGSGASFQNPMGIAVDAAGDVYVADSQNATIRRVTASGVVTTLAGRSGQYGTTDGSGADARFELPWGLAVDREDNVFVSDWRSGKIRKVTPAGLVTTLASQFLTPAGIAVDASGNIYVADTMSDTIRKITPAGVVTTLAGAWEEPGSNDGAGADARFAHPAGVAVDSSGTLYVTDALNSTIRKLTSAGMVTTLGGIAGREGVIPGPLPASLNFPMGIALAPDGALIVSDVVENDILRVH